MDNDTLRFCREIITVLKAIRNELAESNKLTREQYNQLRDQMAALEEDHASGLASAEAIERELKKMNLDVEK